MRENFPKRMGHSWWWHGIEVLGYLNTTHEHDRRKIQILKNSPKGLFLVSVAQMLFSTHVENSSHFPHIEIYCQERLAIFPHILWCEERVSSHFPSPSAISSHFACVELATINFLTFFHTVVRAGKSNEKFLTLFQCVEFRQTLFSLHQFHTCGTFLTFSSLFPHIEIS